MFAQRRKEMCLLVYVAMLKTFDRKSLRSFASLRMTRKRGLFFKSSLQGAFRRAIKKAPTTVEDSFVVWGGPEHSGEPPTQASTFPHIKSPNNC